MGKRRKNQSQKGRVSSKFWHLREGENHLRREAEGAMVSDRNETPVIKANTGRAYQCI